jgi:hypothetical protein
MRVIGERFPDLLQGYLRLYANENKYGTPDLAAAKDLGLPDPWLKGKGFAEKHRIPYRSWRDDGSGT